MHEKSEGASAAVFDRTGFHFLLERLFLLAPSLALFASVNPMFRLPLRICPGLLAPLGVVRYTAGIWFNLEHDTLPFIHSFVSNDHLCFNHSSVVNSKLGPTFF